MARSKVKKSLVGLHQKYGATLRARYTQAFVTLKQKRKCPKCGSRRFGRKAMGIWQCPKCNYKVAGGAYDIVTKKV
jgi:large subunit ribosomal protein L37Ae